MHAPWIYAQDMQDRCVLYRFSRRFAVEEEVEKFTASICADTRYKLYVNGHFVVEGPCHGTEYARHYETVDLTPYLKEGDNLIWADVLHVSRGHYISLYREDKAALWFNGMIDFVSGAKTPIRTSDKWEVYRFENRVQYSFPGYIPSVPISEEMHGCDRFAKIELKVGEEAHPETRCFNGFGVRETYPLTPRPIPNLIPEAPRAMHLIKTEPLAYEYDALRYETAFVKVGISGAPGTKVRVIYAESKTVYVDGKPTKNMRDDPDGVIEGLWDTLVLDDRGALVFETFRFRAFRFIRLEGDKPFTVDSLTFSSYNYPMGNEGDFTCSDPVYREMWETSRRTLLCCSHENYVDCPYYEQQQYDMDAGLEMLFTMRLTNDMRLPKKALFDLASSQLPDGMIQANYPSVVVQVIPSFSLYWVLMLRDYLRYTGDIDYVRSLFGTAEKVLTGFENLLDERGLVGTTDYWPFMDWCPEWGIYGEPDGAREEPLTMYCLMYAATLKAAAEMCDALGKRGLAVDYRIRADKANEAANTYCYDKEAGMYRNTPSRKEYCQHTALWAVLSGAVEGKEAKHLMERIMDAPISRSCFSMNYYLLRALDKVSLYADYAPAVFEGWKKMIAQHCTSWCENPDNPRSECHGWSSTPIFEMSAHVLGVMPTLDGYKETTVRPYTALFDNAKGTVPTPFGTISVSWTKDEDMITLTVEKPDTHDMTVKVHLPHSEVIQKDTVATYTYKEV